VQTIASVFRKNIGVPMCHARGIPLGNEKMSARSEDALHQTLAKDCGMFGNRMGLQFLPVLVPGFMKVALPHVDLIDFESTSGDMDAVSTCATCAHMIPANEVSETLGWNTPMCAAKGKLLLATRIVILSMLIFAAAIYSL
jgi:hypothetical protein